MTRALWKALADDVVRKTREELDRMILGETGTPKVVHPDVSRWGGAWRSGSAPALGACTDGPFSPELVADSLNHSQTESPTFGSLEERATLSGAETGTPTRGTRVTEIVPDYALRDELKSMVKEWRRMANGLRKLGGDYGLNVARAQTYEKSADRLELALDQEPLPL